MGTARACNDGQPNTMSCPHGKVITVNSAKQSKKKKCGWWWISKTCDRPERLNILKNSCENQESCLLPNKDDNDFASLCEQVRGYVEIEYNCVDIGSTNESAATSATFPPDIHEGVSSYDDSYLVETRELLYRTGEFSSEVAEEPSSTAGYIPTLYTDAGIESTKLIVTETGERYVPNSAANTEPSFNSGSALRYEVIVGIVACVLLAILVLVALILLYRKRIKKQEVIAENKENVIYEADASFVVTKNDTALFENNGTCVIDDDTKNPENPSSCGHTFSSAEQTDGGTAAHVMKENILYGTR